VKTARRTSSLLLAGIITWYGGIAFGATLSLGNPATVEDLLAVPVMLTPGSTASVASLQFDLNCNSVYYTIAEVDVGAAAEAAGKQVMFDIQGNSVRVIVAGFNQDAIASGEVAVLYLSPESAHAPMGAYGLEDAVLSDPLGRSLPVTIPESGKHETHHSDHSPEAAPADNTSSETDSTSQDIASTDSSSAKTGTTSSTDGITGLSNVPYWPGVEEGTKSTGLSKSAAHPANGKSFSVPEVDGPMEASAHASVFVPRPAVPGVVSQPSGAKQSTRFFKYGKAGKFGTQSASSEESGSSSPEQESPDIPIPQVAKVETAFQHGGMPPSSLLYDGRSPAYGNEAATLTTMTPGEKMRLEIIAVGVLMGLALCLLGLFTLYRLVRQG